MMTRKIIFTGFCFLIMACNFDYMRERSKIEKNQENQNEESELKKAPHFSFARLISDKNPLSENDILENIQGGDKTGWKLKNIVVSDSKKATFFKIKKELMVWKLGTFSATITLEKKDFKDAVIRRCHFQKLPKEIRIYKIDILNFPAKDKKNNYWDYYTSWHNRKPDLIWEIKKGNTTLFNLPYNKRISNAEQGKTYTFLSLGGIVFPNLKRGNIYTFHLKDYDSSFWNDYMGAVSFTTPSDDASSKIYSNIGNQIRIKIYFYYTL